MNLIQCSLLFSHQSWVISTILGKIGQNSRNCPFKSFISVEQKREASRNRTFIENQMQDAKFQNEKSEDSLTEFRKKNPLRLDTPSIEMKRERLESAVVEIDELNPDEIAHLIETKSWEGKAGSYDLAGEMGRHARLVDGDELAVLGFAPSALKLLD